MRFEYETKIVIDVDSCNLKEILGQFLVCLCPIFGAVVSRVMLHYAEVYAQKNVLGSFLALPSGSQWKWKSKSGGKKTIVIKSLFGKIVLPNPRIEITLPDGQKTWMYIGRKLLEVAPYAQIPDFMKALLGSLGGLMSFRNVEKSMQSFGIFRVSLASIWRSVGWLSRRLGLSAVQTGQQDEIFEADATGVPSLGRGKRGSEAKILMQRVAGKLRFLGVKVGKYGSKADWEALFTPIKDFVDKTKRHILVADGDETIRTVWAAVTTGGLSMFQRCLWHLPHQIKYMLWKDKANAEDKVTVLRLCYNAFLLNKSIALEHLAQYIAMKLDRIENLIHFCEKRNLNVCATFLRNAQHFAFNLGRRPTDNHNTSLTERAMRTVKQRIRYAVWSDKGAENVIKVRLDLFYNRKFRGIHFDT